MAGADRLRDIRAGRCDERRVEIALVTTPPPSEARATTAVHQRPRGGTQNAPICARHRSRLPGRADCRTRRAAPDRARQTQRAPRHRASVPSRRVDVGVLAGSFRSWKWIAAAITSPFKKRRYPVSLPSGRMARPARLLASAHCSRGSWLPPTMGGGSAGTTPNGTRHAGEQPAVEVSTREQPLARDLGARDRLLRHQLVELALFDPQVVGRLGRREQLQACICPAYGCANSQYLTSSKKTRRMRGVNTPWSSCLDVPCALT